MPENISNQQFKYDQVSSHIMQLIENGLLKPGDRAPSLRKLSQSLKVSIATVNQAYLQLENKGVLNARPQSGFFVNSDISTDIEKPKPIISGCCLPRKVRFGELFEDVFTISDDRGFAPFAAARPSMALMPEKALIRETRSVLSNKPIASLDYCFPPGHRVLREQIAERYRKLQVAVEADDIIITSGATEAISLSLLTVARRGDVIAVESPTYFSVLRLIEKLGMLALEIDSDPETGIDLDALEFALDSMNINAMLLVPNFNNPTGSLMPEPNKKQLVKLLTERDIPLIEDDVFGDLYFGEQRPGISKQHDSEGLVLSCSSFSKTLAPGYRMGWIHGGRYHDRLLEWKQAYSSASPTLQQRAIGAYLQSGQYDRHLQRLRKAFKEQIQTARLMISRLFPEGTRISDPSGGFVLWVELPRQINCVDVYHEAKAKKIGITPGMLFSATRKFKNYIRINCGFPWDEHTETALTQLAEIVHKLNV